jgi:hypothetical protein
MVKVKVEVTRRFSGRGRPDSSREPLKPHWKETTYIHAAKRHGCGEPIPFSHEPGVPGLPFPPTFSPGPVLRIGVRFLLTPCGALVFCERE